MDEPAKTRPVVKGRPLNADETYIREKYLEGISKQPELMDSVAKQLLTLELAIPGLYVSILKLVGGKDNTLTLSDDIYLVFAFWLMALICTVGALFPRHYTVDPNNHTQIRESFYRAASYKFIWLGASITAFVCGLIFAVKDILS